jgi:hypothetical protein
VAAILKFPTFIEFPSTPPRGKAMSEFSFCLTEPRTHIRRPLAPYGAIKSRDLGCWVGANLGAADAPSKTTMFSMDPNRSKYYEPSRLSLVLRPAL